MDPRVNEYLENQNNKEREEYRIKKENYLIEHGLVKKDFDYVGPNMKYGINPKTGKKDSYIEVPIEISDEEYEKLIESEKNNNIQDNIQPHPYNISSNNYKSASNRRNRIVINRVAATITIIAVVVFFLSFVMGIVYGYTFKIIKIDSNLKTEEIFNYVSMLITWGIGFVMGTLLLGFAEIIKLLQKIADK